MIACENSGHSILDDFAEVSKIVEAGATSKPKKDYELSRYACYLIVQNGDPRKQVIALGQTYFAIQTYRQEIADHYNQLDEDRRRLVVMMWQHSLCGGYKFERYSVKSCNRERYEDRMGDASQGFLKPSSEISRL